MRRNWMAHGRSQVAPKQQPTRGNPSDQARGRAEHWGKASAFSQRLTAVNPRIQDHSQRGTDEATVKTSP